MLNTYYVPHAVLSPLYEMTHLIFILYQMVEGQAESKFLGIPYQN